MEQYNEINNAYRNEINNAYRKGQKTSPASPASPASSTQRALRSFKGRAPTVGTCNLVTGLKGNTHQPCHFYAFERPGRPTLLPASTQFDVKHASL